MNRDVQCAEFPRNKIKQRYRPNPAYQHIRAGPKEGGSYGQATAIFAIVFKNVAWPRSLRDGSAGLRHGDGCNSLRSNAGARQVIFGVKTTTGAILIYLNAKSPHFGGDACAFEISVI